MPEKKRSKGVSFFGWSIIIFQLGALAQSARPGYFVKYLAPFPLETALRTSIMILFLLGGIGILRLLSWARKLVIWVTIIAFFDLIFFCLTRMPKLPGVDIRTVVLTAMIMIFIYYLATVYFFTRPKVKAQFNKKTSGPVPDKSL